MKRFFKRFVSLATLGAFLFSMYMPPARAESTVYGMGDLTTGDVQNHGTGQPSDFSRMRSTPPSSIDLSESFYFPQIVGDQGSIGSCCAWASTYYQFTYHANKLNNITTTYENSYSPTWTYNIANYGVDDGSSLNFIYSILTKQGALRMEDCPYDANNYSLGWSTNTEAMIEALGTRLNYNVYEDIVTTTNQITSTSDSALDVIKQIIGVEE